MVKQNKDSRQRRAILATLCGTQCHPTAQELFEAVRIQLPNISLATVYRNLNVLCEDSKAIKLTVDGADHYDATVEPHVHFTCRCCKQVFDVDLEHDEGLDRLAQEAIGGVVTGHTLMFQGICNLCAQKLN